MQVILLEKVSKLGVLGDIVEVKNGYGRNFLIPKKMAIRATKSNVEYFEKQKAKLEEENLANKKLAEDIVADLKGKTIIVIRQAGEDGRLYGSVTARDLSVLLKSQLNKDICHTKIVINSRLKDIGNYKYTISLHPEVTTDINVIITRSEEEGRLEEKRIKKEANASNKPSKDIAEAQVEKQSA